MEEVECELGLRNELVPQEFRERDGHACKNEEKLSFKRLDYAFHCIAAVHVRGNKLDGCVPFSLDL